MFEYYFSPDKKTTVCVFKSDAEGNGGPRREAFCLIKSACTYRGNLGTTGWNGVDHFVENVNSTELFFNKCIDAIDKKMPKSIIAKTTLRGNDIYDEEEGKKIAKAKCLTKFYVLLEKIYQEEINIFTSELEAAQQRMENVIELGILRNRSKVLKAMAKK